MKRALNHMTTPMLDYLSFLDLAAGLGCVGVEVRNDLARPLFDGLPPGEAGRAAAARGLQLLGVSQIYPFNHWTEDRDREVRSLIDVARTAGARSISLIPRNDGLGCEDDTRHDNLRRALAAILPLLQDADLIALVEPLGFARASLRAKSEAVAAIAELGGEAHFQLVHDTFHHTLAGGGPLSVDQTGLVHISGVVDPSLSLETMEDAHRVLVDADDRLGNIAQLAALREAGYDGPVSYECFAPEVHALADPATAIRRSFDFIETALAAG